MLKRLKSVAGSSHGHKNSVATFHEPLYIILFSKLATEETINWIMDLLQRSQHDGGAELQLQAAPATKHRGVILEISAKPLRLLEAAEMMDIKKEDKCGNIREFIFSSIDLFLKPGVTYDNLLTTSEKQRLILHEIMSLQSMDKKQLIGCPGIKLYPGQSVVQVCQSHGIIEQIFPLHEPIDLQTLEDKWNISIVAPQPLDDIRNYFGEAVGFYFAFLSFYTSALIPPAILGIVQTAVSHKVGHLRVCFAILKMIWLTLFLECWKRKSSELAYTWGTLTSAEVPRLHPTFRGKFLEIDPVTKQRVPVYPGYRRHFKVYCVTSPIVFLCLIFATIVMLIYYQVENYMMEIYGDESDIFSLTLVQLPGIVYSILVVVMSGIYRHLANFLTEWENHKTQISFDNHRIVKLLLFEFVNNFSAIGYIAFYVQDINLLRWQICIMLLVCQVINHLQEAVIPLASLKLSRMWRLRHRQASSEVRIQRALDESDMWPYEGTYDDYLELFIQFGYVFLFSSVYPLAAAFAFINNMVEMWVDKMKLCKAYQRPQARPVKGIGIWQAAFEILGVFAVMTNCALISMSSLAKSVVPDLSVSTVVLIAVTVEHFVIGIKILLSYLISDVPKWVQVAIRKAQYESLQALKAERMLRTRELLKKLEKSNINKEE